MLDLLYTDTKFKNETGDFFIS